MIQEGHRSAIESSSEGVTETEFDIEVNESMCQMLTSNVYSDPVLAVVREWSTNACDACIAAGNEVNYDVHLPTVKEPTFYVRDYGTGISPNDITTVFSKLGASTKRDSNKYNGTLGIGRMAGLAAANAFTVETYYNGELHSYVISIKEGKIVTLHLGTVDTDEPNGVKMSVAVSYDDLYLYTKAAETLYPFFDHKPNLNDDIKLTLPIKHCISEDWFIREPENHYESTNYVVMSQVAYAIPRNAAIDDKGFQNLVIKAPNGAVTFNPGRESLSLDKRTIDFVNKAFEKVAEEYVTDTHNHMVLAENDMEVMKLFMASANAPTSVRQNIDPMPFISAELTNIFFNPPGNGVMHSRIGSTSEFKKDTNNLLAITFKPAHYKTSAKLGGYTTAAWMDFCRGTHILVDVKTKFRNVINKRYEGKPLFLWIREDKQDIDQAVKEAKRYLDTIGVEYTLASDILKDIPVEEYVIKPREGLYASRISSSGVINKATKHSEEAATAETFLYVKLKHTTPQLSGDKTFREYMQAYSLLNDIAQMPPIRGVPKKYQGCADALDNWVDFETYINDKMKEVSFRRIANFPVKRMETELICDVAKHRYPQEIQKAFNVIQEYEEYKQSPKLVYSDMVTLVELFDGTFEDFEPTVPVDYDHLFATYPKTMILLTGRNYNDRIDTTFVSEVAKLERFYETHSSK